MRQQNGRFNETADRSFICKPLFSLTDALGTAFVVGLLEIFAGEIETGVTRFIGVSVKTFVLCLGAGFGLMLVSKNVSQIWEDQASNCGALNLHDSWWRVPLYLACSASCLGQYRFPIGECRETKMHTQK